jgi:phosphoglycolate phosphatase-like HAD superfamily hydrolase
MIRAVAFDFDGTLVRSNAIKRQAFYDAVVDIPGAVGSLDALFAANFKGDRYDLLTAMCQRLAPDSTPAAARRQGLQLAAVYGVLCRKQISICPEVPGVMTILRTLRERDIGVYIVSATPETDLRPIVSDRGFGQFLKGVFGAPTGKGRHLKNILTAENISPAELAMVGDGGDDLAAAEAVGCRFVGVGYSGNETLPAAARMIEDLHPLSGLLLND